VRRGIAAFSASGDCVPDQAEPRISIPRRFMVVDRFLLRAYPERGLTLSGGAKKTNEIDSPPKGQTPFRIGFQ
jgi:hypothetical protein